jgi:hypothetical protein
MAIPAEMKGAGLSGAGLVFIFGPEDFASAVCCGAG